MYRCTVVFPFLKSYPQVIISRLCTRGNIKTFLRHVITSLLTLNKAIRNFKFKKSRRASGRRCSKSKQATGIHGPKSLSARIGREKNWKPRSYEPEPRTSNWVNKSETMIQKIIFLDGSGHLPRRYNSAGMVSTRIESVQIPQPKWDPNVSKTKFQLWQSKKIISHRVYTICTDRYRLYYII